MTISPSRTERRPARKDREEREAVEGMGAAGLDTEPRRTIWRDSEKEVREQANSSL